MITGALVLFGLACVGMGIGVFLFSFGYAYPEIKAYHDYKSAHCNITSHNDIVLDCNSYSSKRCDEYVTSVNVLLITAHDNWLAAANRRNNYKFSSYESAQVWLNSNPIGSSKKCYYDPDSTQDVAFSIRLSSDNVITPIVLGSVFCLIVSIVGPGVAVIFGVIVLRNMKKFDSDNPYKNEDI